MYVPLFCCGAGKIVVILLDFVLSIKAKTVFELLCRTRRNYFSEAHLCCIIKVLSVYSFNSSSCQVPGDLCFYRARRDDRGSLALNEYEIHVLYTALHYTFIVVHRDYTCVYLASELFRFATGTASPAESVNRSVRY